MINKPPPFKGLNIRIPVILTIEGRRFLNQGSAILLMSIFTFSCMHDSLFRSRMISLYSSLTKPKP